MNIPNTSSVRKTQRTKKPSLKAMESLYTMKLQHSGFFQYINSDGEESLSDEEYLNDIEKPKQLHEKEIIHGEEIFKFQTRKEKSNLANKVAEACSQKTPYSVRTKTKKKIAEILQDDSESEYEVSTEETCSSDQDELSSDSDSKSPHKRKVNRKFVDVNLQNRKTRNKGNYTIRTDDYFDNYTSTKVHTSNNTLDKLETPRLPQYLLQELLRNMKLSKEHMEKIKALSNTNESYFKKWLYLLNENFNILIYGLGSKRNILHKFQMDYLKDVPVIVVNGYFPTMSIKNVLDSIIVDLLELNENPNNPIEACEMIIQEFKSIPDTNLYIIIHNIEGEMIRNCKSQNILAKLTCIRNIHLIASIDHINAPLIWDHSRLSKLNYIWWDVTSFLPYIEETSFEKSMMVQQSGTLALSSLHNVFLSLTTNSKSIYIKIVKHQLENDKNQYYQGLAFKDLYMSCRDDFIVSSDLALRAQLTEFIDHKMVKTKRSVDGTEYLSIPLVNNLLQKFLEENS